MIPSFCFSLNKILVVDSLPSWRTPSHNPFPDYILILSVCVQNLILKAEYLLNAYLMADIFKVL